MNSFVKVIILVFMIIYVVSPVDLMPGPIDDIIVVLAGMLARRGIEARRA